MKRLIVLFVFSLTLSTLAVAAKYYWQADRFREIGKAAEYGMTGDYEVTKFWIKDLDLDEELEELLAIYQDEDADDETLCRYTGKIGRTFAIDTIENKLGDLDTADALWSIYRKRRFIGAITIYWDEESGEDIWCEQTHIQFWGIDGSKLTLTYSDLY